MGSYPYILLLSSILLNFLVVSSNFLSIATAEPISTPSVQFSLPEDDIPDDPLGTVIQYGEDLVIETQTFAKPYVGNGLNCRSCHLEGGTIPNAIPFVGVPGLYPMHSPVSGKVISIQERINQCFQTSLNGKPLALDSTEMTAIVAYMSWLSQGVPTGAEVEGRGASRLAPPSNPPNPEGGRKLFSKKCSHCHGEEGQGLQGSKGSFVFPPLWGDNSFNMASDMARLNIAAAFIKNNMPFGQEGSLTDQEAYDIASFITTQPRPDFPDQKNAQ